MDAGEKLPFDLDGAAIYYAGPTPAKPGQVIGSVGPTTSGRMDPFAPRLLDAGLSCMIGKGVRNQNVQDAMERNGAVYMVAIGGAGAAKAASIKKVEVIAYDELGCESVKRLTVENFSRYRFAGLGRRQSVHRGCREVQEGLSRQSAEKRFPAHSSRDSAH